MKPSVIELYISASYAWSVWKKDGGLQPTVESLALPPEARAPLREWTFRKVPGLHAPTFSGRQAHDAEGRALAIALQHAVGNRLQVVFRHWISFDRQHWRTLSGEENLLTGKRQEFFTHVDLPEEIAVSVLRIFPDVAGAYSWDLNACCIGNENPVFPEDLDERFTSWAKRWDAHRDFETGKPDKAALAAEGFDEQGLALAAELKGVIGPAAKVIYYCTLRAAALEVAGDATTIKWPRKTDFRQWALDHADRLPGQLPQTSFVTPTQ